MQFDHDDWRCAGLTRARTSPSPSRLRAGFFLPGRGRGDERTFRANVLRCGPPVSCERPVRLPASNCFRGSHAEPGQIRRRGRSDGRSADPRAARHSRPPEGRASPLCGGAADPLLGADAVPVVLPRLPARLAAIHDGLGSHQLPHVRRSGRGESRSASAQARTGGRSLRRRRDGGRRDHARRRRLRRLAPRDALLDRRRGRQRSAQPPGRAKYRRCDEAGRSDPFGALPADRAPEHGEGWLWPFDNPEFSALFDVVGVERTWEIYIETLIAALDSQPAQILGHFYVPAKFGHWPEREKLEAYEDRIIEVCREREIAIELNSRAFYRNQDEEQHRRYREANERLLKKAKAAGVLIAVGSDAHSPRDQGRAFEIVLEMLDAAEINELAFPIGGRFARVALRASKELLEQRRAVAPVAVGSSISGLGRAELAARGVALPPENEVADRCESAARAKPQTRCGRCRSGAEAPAKAPRRVKAQAGGERRAGSRSTGAEGAQARPARRQPQPKPRRRRRKRARLREASRPRSCGRRR